MVLLFGRKFQAANPAGLMPAGAIYGLNSALEEDLRGLGRPVSIMQAEIVGLVVTAIALALLLRPFGIVGAALASALSYTTVMIVLLAHARWITGESLGALFLPTRHEIHRGLEGLQLVRKTLRTAVGELLAVRNEAA